VQEHGRRWDGDSGTVWYPTVPSSIFNHYTALSGLLSTFCSPFVRVRRLTAGLLTVERGTPVLPRIPPIHMIIKDLYTIITLPLHPHSIHSFGNKGLSYLRPKPFTGPSRGNPLFS